MNKQELIELLQKNIHNILLLCTIGTSLYFIMSFLKAGKTISKDNLDILLSVLMFGSMTYISYVTRCPKCLKSFVLKQQKDKTKLTEKKKEPYTYYSRVLINKDGTTENDPSSRTTIMREKQYFEENYKCKRCGFETSKTKGKWIGEAPKQKQVLAKK